MANRKEMTSNARIRFNLGGGPEDSTKGSGSTHLSVHGMRARVEQRLPGAHFEADGLSTGKQTGPIRGPDAYQGEVFKSGESN
jgi:hypothetical protein